MSCIWDMQKNIDYSIIWKYFNDALTDEEHSELDDWLNADEQHRAYFNALKGLKEVPEISSEAAWKKMQLIPKRSKRVKRIISYF